MQRTPINPWDWSLKLGYNQAEIIEGTSRQLICAGQTAVDEYGKPQHLGDMRCQIDLALKKIRYGLENNIRAFLSNELIEHFSKIDVMEDEIKELYVKFSENYQPTTEYNASHILLETESDAIEILNKLQNGSDFLELAKTYSTGPSGKQGGSLGWFGRGAMVPTFEQAVLLLKVNEVSKPIKTNFGWHIIKVNNIRETPVPSLEDVRGDLVSTIRQNKVETKINKLIDSANVIYSDLEINHKIIRNESILDNK